MRGWIKEAQRLREGGMFYRQIAARLGRGETTVRNTIKGVHVGRYCGTLPAPVAAKPEAHKYRTPKQKIPREVITEAARAFARFEIDRAELMRRITPA